MLFNVQFYNSPNLKYLECVLWVFHYCVYEYVCVVCDSVCIGCFQISSRVSVCVSLCVKVFFS